MTHPVFLTITLGLAACTVSTPKVPLVPPRSGHDVTSNILRADYAGSKACDGCHADVYAAWSGSPMQRMTRTAAPLNIRAPFDGRTWHFKDDAARFDSVNDERFMSVTSLTQGDHAYRVTRVIGGRYREDYAGVEVDSARAGARTLAAGHDELLLPVSFIYETASFRLKGYSVMVKERPGLRAGGVWNQTCIFCHNTVPLFDTLWGALAGSSVRGYQGADVDRLLPADRRMTWQVTDADGLANALQTERSFLGSSAARANTPKADLLSTMAVAGRNLAAKHFIELGVGCEACHGGSAEHVRAPVVRPSFEPRSPFLRATLPSQQTPSRATWINRSCARCHQVLFSRYPFTWENSTRNAPTAGGSGITSGEARDFLLGGCASRMACTDCHDPHHEDDRAALARLATPAGNRVCIGCHDTFKSVDAQRAHSHHDPAGAGGACIGCHMPRKNMGLNYSLTRYHRIGSPNETQRVQGDRPLECALCHTHDSSAQLLATMESWWGKQYDRATLTALYGDLDVSPLLTTLNRGKPHEQGTVLGLLAEQPVPGTEAGLARALVHDHPLLRLFAKKALDLALNRPCAVNLDSSRDEIAKAAAVCVPGVMPAKLHAPMGHDSDED